MHRIKSAWDRMTGLGAQRDKKPLPVDLTAPVGQLWFTFASPQSRRSRLSGSDSHPIHPNQGSCRAVEDFQTWPRPCPEMCRLPGVHHPPIPPPTEAGPLEGLQSSQASQRTLTVGGAEEHLEDVSKSCSCLF